MKKKKPFKTSTLSPPPPPIITNIRVIVDPKQNCLIRRIDSDVGQHGSGLWMDFQRLTAELQIMGYRRTALSRSMSPRL